MALINIKQTRGLTQGSVLFLGNNGIVSEDNSGLYWDFTNKGLGVATQSDTSYAINVSGDVNILGTLYATSKSFEITHPLDPNKRLTYGSLEGPEYGVYFRGKLNNSNIIELPDYWVNLIDYDTLTVNLTPICEYQKLFFEKVEHNKVYIGHDSNLPVCFYVVYAERKDIPKIQVEK